MGRRSCWFGIGLLAVGAVVVGSLFALHVVGPPRWPDGTVFVPRDVATLRDAIDRADPGTTIVLRARAEPYVGPLTIETPNVTLAAAGGVATLAADGADPALTVRADGVTVRGLTIVSENVGLRVESARCTVEDVRIRAAPVGVQLVGAQACDLRAVEISGGQRGLELASSAGNRLSDIVVVGAAESGVKALGSWGNTLERIDVSDAPTGISLERGSSDNDLRDCRVERASIVGVEFRGATDNRLAGSAVRDARVGVVLDGVTGVRIEDCTIDGVDVTGLAFQQAVQNRATGNRIEASGDVGIRLSQSAENALSYNRIAQCAGAGIRLDASDRNLLIGNRLEANGVGIDADRSSGGQFLRNGVVRSDEIAIRLSGGSDNRVFDNDVRDGTWGVLLSASSGTTLLRNRFDRQGAAGLAVIRGSQATYVVENVLAGSRVGILVGDSARCAVLNNVVRENGTGMLLVRAGSEVRIEGNAIESNRVGLLQSEEPDVPGVEDLLDGGGETTAPVLASNRFARNEAFDVSNETSSPIYAAGNWWDEAAARVSGGVDLEGSAWRGTVAIGTEVGVSQEILGRILQQALTAAGFRVIDLIAMGSSEQLHEAFRAEDVDFVWWGTSETLFRDEADDSSRIVLTAAPAVARWTFVVPEATALDLPAPTMSAYAALLREAGDRLRYATTEALDRTVSAAFEDAYGLGDVVGSANWAATLGEAETLLKFGAVDMAIVSNLEETLTLSGFVALEDDLGALPSADLLVASRSELLARFPEIEELLTDLVGSLTTAAIHDLSGRVRLLQQPAESAARGYLVRHGYLEE